jgi:putative spermidine/putrescine transport system permease protein
MIAPAALSSSLLVFAFIIGAFETPYLLGRTYPAMLPVVAQQRYMDPDLTMRPGAIAMAVLLSVLTTGLVWLYLKLAQRWSGIERPLFF